MSNKFGNMEPTLEPHERLKQLINYSNEVKVEPRIPPARYYNSGREMIRMANVYYDEGSLESAYVLYLKFMTIFLEKIRSHPDFKTVPPKMKEMNQMKLREVLPKAEKLKEQLFQQYQAEYEKCLAETKQEEEERRKRESEKKKSTSKVVPSIPCASIIAELPGSIKNVDYPDPNEPSAPPLPLVEKEETPIAPTPKTQPPVIDRAKKPTDLIHDHYSSTALRTVIVPTKVMVMFQSLAQKNTASNIETCAVLTGKLEKNVLIITHMILPKQKGTSDSCATMNEEEIFDYQDQHNLITIGWIHTHPTQTAFLSSVDLHTHCPYQLLMPEAIAIVCAPKYNQTGFFILTPNHGLQFIANCKQTGFHPHPTEPPLFKVADHIKIENNAPLDVLDLRT